MPKSTCIKYIFFYITKELIFYERLKKDKQTPESIILRNFVFKIIFFLLLYILFLY